MQYSVFVLLEDCDECTVFLCKKEVHTAMESLRRKLDE